MVSGILNWPNYSNEIPHLVDVTRNALPHLHDVTTTQQSTRQIQTLALSCPRDSFISSNRELLVRVPSEACVDLHLNTISRGSRGDIKTFVAKNLKGSANVCPGLRTRSTARLDLNGGTVCIRHGGQAKATTGSRANGFASGRSAAGGKIPYLIRATRTRPHLHDVPVSENPIRQI